MRILLCEWKDLEAPACDIGDPKWERAWDDGYRAAKDAIAEQSVEVTAEELADWRIDWMELRMSRYSRTTQETIGCIPWEDFLTRKLERRQQDVMITKTIEAKKEKDNASN